jgi:peptide/nickel transport system ATP-binding protein
MAGSQSAAQYLEVDALRVAFEGREGLLEAVKGVSFSLARGERVGLVGESGSGKSTLARVLLGLQAAHGGRVCLEGVELTSLSPAEWRPFRRRLQMVFQDPVRSLNPRMRLGQLLAEPLRIHFPHQSRSEREARIAELLTQVGLEGIAPERFPADLSGGQRQRLGIARALAVRPEFLVLDEPVSALDVSVQAQILNLLLDLRDAYGLGWLFIGHDLAVIEQVCERVLVMCAGELVEQGAVREVYAQPRHPYTRTLLEAARANSTIAE